MSGDFVDLTWIDVLGRPRAIRAATAELASVVEQLPVPLDQVLRGAAGVAWLRPDSGAVFPSPWEGGVEIQLCDLADDDGNPSPYCTRSVLKRALRRLVEERLDAVRVLEVDADRAPAAVEHLEPPGVEAPFDRLRAVDAHDVGPQVGEQHRRERPRADARDLDDPHVRQRSHSCDPS